MYRQSTLQRLQSGRDEGRALVRKLTTQIRPVRLDVIDEARVNLTHKHAESRPVLKKVTSVRAPKGLTWSLSRKNLERNLISERSRDDADVSVSHERRLNKRLERLELEMVVMIGDGNCQFRALSTATCGDASQHPQLRALAVDWMREHREAFECFLGEDFDAYLESMARDGTWGDELTLRALSDALGLVINVITSDFRNWYLQYLPSHEELKESTDVFLAYIAPIHYNSIRRKESLARTVTTGAVDQAEVVTETGIVVPSGASGGDGGRGACLPLLRGRRGPSASSNAARA